MKQADITFCKKNLKYGKYFCFIIEGLIDKGMAECKQIKTKRKSEKESVNSIKINTEMIERVKVFAIDERLNFNKQLNSIKTYLLSAYS